MGADFNVYGRQLSAAEIDAGRHRELVGGLWEEMGALQFEFLRARGLEPGHRLADVGCGALRGGLHFIRYLGPGRYFGMDINASLLDAGRAEVARAGLAGRAPNLLADDRFALRRFATTFDCAIAVSLFTHLPVNSIVRCLSEVRAVLAPGARFYASYFEAPSSPWLEPLPHTPGGIVTNFDADPFHYAFADMQWMAGRARMRVELVGSWDHPRDQRMLAFSAAE